MMTTVERFLRWCLSKVSRPRTVFLAASGTSRDFVFSDYPNPQYVCDCVAASMASMKSCGCKRCVVFCSPDMVTVLSGMSLAGGRHDGGGDYMVVDQLLKPNSVRIQHRY
jgi:hypothetical protein